jgi:lysophospholipase L1-like esterase
MAIAANGAGINVSDYCGSVTIDASKISFTRPTVDGQGFEFANPGARVRFRTDSLAIRFKLQFTNLVTRLDTYNATTDIFVDGVKAAEFTRSQGAAGGLTYLLDLGTQVERDVEVVFPYSASVDFTGLDLMPGSTLGSAATRPATRLVTIGDSITHGFNVSGETTSWSFKLGALKNWQVINHGYGGRLCVPSDGTTLAALNPTVAIYLIGYNNFYPQVPLATFKADYKSFINNFRAVNTTAKLYCMTPTWTPNTFGALTIEMYRQQIRDALTELGNALNILVEGPSLATGDLARFPDGVHPNDAGALQMANSLNSIVVV